MEVLIICLCSILFGMFTVAEALRARYRDNGSGIVR